jgi:hypothetical protein
MCAIGGQTTVCAASREAAGFVADCVSGRGCIARQQPRYPDLASLREVQTQAQPILESKTAPAVQKDLSQMRTAIV